MKTKAQKQLEVEEGQKLFDKSEALLFVDFGKVRTADMRLLRNDLKKSGNPMFLMKKRLLNLILKKKGMEYNDREHKTSVATIFASNLEEAASTSYKFLSTLEREKKVDGQKLLGGYDIKAKAPIPQDRMLMIGRLPPREVLLSQLLGMIAAPIKSLLYVMQEKSKRSS